MFYCIYCNNSSAEGPQQNKFLTDALWEMYHNRYGVELLSASNMMPGTLKNDISFRLCHIQLLIQTIKNKKKNITSIPGPIASAINDGITLVDRLKEIKSTCDRLNTEIINDNDLDIHLKEYLRLLNGADNHNTKCESFIKLCETLLYYIEQANFENNFPSLYQIMIGWENSLMNNDKFQPKVIELFKAFQTDLSRLIIPGLPFRIGVIGEISAGKTSLLNHLREITDEDINSFQTTSAVSQAKLVSPMRVGKSTLCQLEFEHEYTNEKKVTFVDIEGATDNDSELSAGNYFDEIKKANCDLYIIVFDHKFQEIYTQWQNYIQDEMHRECWFVRNKIDDLFLKIFQEDVGEDFNLVTEKNRICYGKRIVKRVREVVSYDTKAQKLSNLYLTFCSYHKNSSNEILSKMEFGKFDLQDLINNIKTLPSDLQKDSLLMTNTHATAKVINTCFRRGYVVNILKYKIYAGVASVIPFADLIARYCGREAIRKAFGVNSRSRFDNWWTNQTDEFKDYLKQFNIATRETNFKTSSFKKTVRSSGVSTAPKVNAAASTVLKGVTTAGITGLSVSDDVVRLLGVGAITAVRGASIGLLVGGIVVTAGMCAWSAVSNGKQMYKYLNGLCDDLIFISRCVAAKIIENNSEIRRRFSTDITPNRVND
jgi:GTPase SAR1 family protein